MDVRWIEMDVRGKEEFIRACVRERDRSSLYRAFVPYEGIGKLYEVTTSTLVLFYESREKILYEYAPRGSIVMLWWVTSEEEWMENIQCWTERLEERGVFFDQLREEEMWHHLGQMTTWKYKVLWGEREWRSMETELGSWDNHFKECKDSYSTEESSL